MTFYQIGKGLSRVKLREAQIGVRPRFFFFGV